MNESAVSEAQHDDAKSSGGVWWNSSGMSAEAPQPNPCGSHFMGIMSGHKRSSEPKEDDMASLIAKELNQLSLKERSHLYEELHGVASTPRDNETPERIKELSGQLLQEVKRIRDRSAFDKAMFLSPSYVSDPDFLAMFLRTDDYNLKLAARRLVRHFHHKLELWGEARLGRPIVYDDLDDDDKEAMLTGRIQILENRRDMAGRLVLYAAEGDYRYKKPVNQIRASWYLFMRYIATDLDGQLKGVVMVRYAVEASLFDPRDAEFKRQCAWMPGAVPLKVMAYHFCYNDATALPAMALTQMMMGMAWRIRFRAHYGSYLECLYSLMTFGIPKEIIPVHSVDGRPMVEEFLADHEKHVQNERASVLNETGRILLPQENDVLLGRGRPYQEFPGNRRLADIIFERKDEYKDSGKLHKTELTNTILTQIKAYGGRFLKKSDDGDYWVVVTDEVAREKVSHGFRTKTKKQDESSAVVSLFGLADPPPELRSSEDSNTEISASGRPKKARIVEAV